MISEEALRPQLRLLGCRTWPLNSLRVFFFLRDFLTVIPPKSLIYHQHPKGENPWDHSNSETDELDVLPPLLQVYYPDAVSLWLSSTGISREPPKLRHVAKMF